MKDLSHGYSKTAFKYYLQYFFGYFLLNFLVYAIAELLNFNIGNLASQENKSLSIIIMSLHIILLSFIVFKANKDLNLICDASFRLNYLDLFGATLLGLGMGRLLPLIATSGYLFPNIYLYNLTDESIKSFATFYNSMTVPEFLFSLFLGSILFSILRELFFRGILLPSFQKDLKISKATTQTSIFFVLVYYVTQINQLEFFSLFVFSIFLCFITFKSESLIPAIVATIAYDLPFIFMIINDSFYKNPFYYMVFNTDFILEYLIYAVAIVVGVFIFIKRQVKSDII